MLTPLRVVVPVASAVAMLQWAVSLGVDERCRVSRGVGSDPNVSLCDAPKWFLGFSIVLLSVLVLSIALENLSHSHSSTPCGRNLKLNNFSTSIADPVRHHQMIRPRAQC